MKALAPARAALIGAASGLRSQLGPAAVAVSGAAAGAPEPLALLSARPVVIGTVTAAVGELVVDKLPMTPSRLSVAGLVPRFLFGGLAAAVLAADAAKPVTMVPNGNGGLTGAEGDGAADGSGLSPGLLGAAAAVGGGAAVAAAFAGACWRRTWARRCYPDWPAALLEDAVALTLALTACTRPPPSPRTGDAAAW
ncbi:Uncharacterized membrane protein [Actinacidiphila yanglinensis]|uniref:Uncharacterized membrane protein n=1 Tax=Actinacidiphila yanglinensis TaxID=310779 RepID=A0A1H6E814_9ACTN|nr:hypothetical protein [Actinacidiphila yanglinensis]SEG93289.1 Uncharacterized membrane protein [Actinacidiphila yanglinensis]